MRNLWLDAKYAVRLMLKSPGFVLVAVVSLALGIGANTVIFSIVNTLLLRPLPVAQPERLVTVLSRNVGEGNEFNSLSYPDYEDIAERNNVFDGVATTAYIPVGLKVGDGDATILLAQQVTVNFFDVIGVRPILGRTFTPEEGETDGTHPVAMISEELWRGRFNGDEQVIGRSVLLNGYPFTIVGVVPDAFEGLNIGIEPELWTPMQMYRQASPFDFDMHSRGNQFTRGIARLKPGVTREQALADLSIIATSLAEEFPDTNDDKGFNLLPANDDRIMVNLTGGADISGLMIVLMTVVGLVLLIACSNVASILMARATRRRKEIAIRLAMGAGRARVIRQLLTESTLLGVIAGGVGVLLAMWGIGLIQSVDLPFFERFPVDFSLDRSVLLFTFGLSVLTGLVFGLLPALQIMRPNIVPALKDQGLTLSQTAGRSRLQNVLVGGQMAMSLFLLIVAGMYIRSLQNAERLDPGFEVDHNAVISVNVGLSQYDEAQGRRFYDELLRRTRALPGVVAAGFADGVPFGFNRSSSTVSIPGYEPRENESMSISRYTVSEGYFRAMGVPILQGRGFEETDDEDADRVMVINQEMADRYFGGVSEAIGGIVRMWGEDRRVIGVARTGKYERLGEAPRPFLYLPARQEYFAWQNLHVRTETDPEAMLGTVAQVVHDIDPNLPLFSVDTMEGHMGFALLPARIIGALVGLFGAIALVLAVTGVYGVMAYSVAQRTGEFGIRMAIGAQPGDVLRLVLRKGLLITGIGMGIGLGVAIAAGSVISAQLYGVAAVDPIIFGGVIVILLGVAMMACLVPARRAMRVDPMTALRCE